MGKQMSDEEVRLNFEALRDELRRETVNARQYKIETFFMRLSDICLIVLGVMTIYLAGAGTLPWYVSAICCGAFGLCSYLNHNNR
jgi:hypothetical protein